MLRQEFIGQGRKYTLLNKFNILIIGFKRYFSTSFNIFMSLNPRTIGKYEILGTIGRGSMGVVYKAKDPGIGRTVAIKVLRTKSGATAFTSEAAKDRFKKEAISAGNLRHPRIVTVFDADIDGETPYIVMDYLEGEVLEDIIKREGRLSVQRALEITSQIAEGLDYAHAKGIIHKDIKPANILCDAEGNIHILDFGVASIGDGEKSDLVMGTPSYMSPEQILNKTLDHRSDLFSLAIVSFELFTGKRPYSGTTFNEVVSEILANRKKSLTEEAPELPLLLEQQFEKALSREREVRFSSGKDLVDSFKKAVEPNAKPTLLKVGAQSSTDNEVIDSGAFENEFTRAEHLRTERERILNELKTKEKHSERQNWFKTGTILLGVVCLMLALILFIKLLFPTGGITPEEASKIVKDKKPSSTLNFQVSSTPPRKGVPLVELTNSELLGALTLPDISEKDLLEAMNIAFERKIPGLFESLLPALLHDSYIVRKEAITIIGMLKDRRGVDAVLPLLDDQDPSVRLSVAQTLEQLGDAKSISFLRNHSLNEKDQGVKAALSSAIRSITGLDE